MGGVFIPKKPPETAMNPRALKREGIRALQDLAGAAWSHYNDVDPGVTLLEHLCWALSEVAYRADFPLEDLLTGPHGEFSAPGQFPAQADILSHQPVSDDDFAKLLLDVLPDLRAVRLTRECDAAGRPTGRRLCRLAARPDLDEACREALRRAAWTELRRRRLPGEDVLPPVWFTLRPLGLSARLQLRSPHGVDQVIEACRLRLDRFAVPIPRQDGYGALRAKGLDGAAIIDGPRLENGWMPGPLPALPRSVGLEGPASVLAGVDGVGAVLDLRLLDGLVEVTRVELEAGEIISWILDLEFWCGGRCCGRLQGGTASPGLAAMRDAHAAGGIAAGIDLQAPLPRGRYRDPAEYHPVQATLPPNWEMTGREVGQIPRRQAQVRQLQGYLMPFEQMLANQFAQLAHLGELFSPFQPPPPERSGRPEDVPWHPLVRTAFSRPLFQVPDVEALLSARPHFDVWLGEPRPREAWREAREFSHNSYVQALAALTESEDEALTRRLSMLRHLMARYGEEAVDYDEMILACRWFGGREYTLIIVFGLWLQNIVFLSRARCCAARFPAPPLRLPGDPAMAESSPALAARLDSTAPDLPWWRRLRPWPERNGRVDVERIQALSALDDDALDGLSSFELKAGLLLDLPTRLADLAARLLRVLYAPGARQWLRTAARPGQCHMGPEDDLYLLARPDRLWLCEGVRRPGEEEEQVLLEILRPPPGTRAGWPDFWRTDHEPAGSPAAAIPDPPMGGEDERMFMSCHAHAWQLLWLATQRRGMLLIEPLLWEDGRTNSPPAPAARLFWPDWVPLLHRHMADFIETLRLRHWPAHAVLEARGASFAELAALIPDYVAWHNRRGREDGEGP